MKEPTEISVLELRHTLNVAGNYLGILLQILLVNLWLKLNETELCVCYTHNTLIPNCCASQVDVLAAHVGKTSELPEDGQKRRPKHVGAIIHK